jgi:hypothetical protein
MTTMTTMTTTTTIAPEARTLAQWERLGSENEAADAKAGAPRFGVDLSDEELGAFLTDHHAEDIERFGGDLDGAEIRAALVRGYRGGRTLEERIEAVIEATAAKCTATLREQGWTGGAGEYSCTVLTGDREALRDALGREPEDEETAELDRAVRAGLDRTAEAYPETAS